MSRATAEFYATNGDLIGYGTYQGSPDLLQIDYALPTADEAWAFGKWDRHPDVPCDKHDVNDVACIVYSDYGNGFWWPSTYCPRCKKIRNFCPWDRDDGGLPYGWPADGHPFRARAKLEAVTNRVDQQAKDIEELERRLWAAEKRARGARPDESP